MRRLLKPNVIEGENTCMFCIYCEKKDRELYCVLKRNKTENGKKCRKFEFDISAKSVKKKHKPLINADFSDF